MGLGISGLALDQIIRVFVRPRQVTTFHSIGDQLAGRRGEVRIQSQCPLDRRCWSAETSPRRRLRTANQSNTEVPARPMPVHSWGRGQPLVPAWRSRLCWEPHHAASRRFASTSRRLLRSSDAWRRQRNRPPAPSAGTSPWRTFVVISLRMAIMFGAATVIVSRQRVRLFATSTASRVIWSWSPSFM